MTDLIDLMIEASRRVDAYRGRPVFYVRWEIPRMIRDARADYLAHRRELARARRMRRALQRKCDEAFTREHETIMNPPTTFDGIQ